MGSEGAAVELKPLVFREKNSFMISSVKIGVHMQITWAKQDSELKKEFLEEKRLEDIPMGITLILACSHGIVR